jgi:hypothetical protein
VSFVVVLFASEPWKLPAAFILFSVLGCWALLNPRGALRWARAVHRGVNADDHSNWWIARLIAGCFLLIALLIALR